MKTDQHTHKVLMLELAHLLPVSLPRFLVFRNVIVLNIELDPAPSAASNILDDASLTTDFSNSSVFRAVLLLRLKTSLNTQQWTAQD